MYRAALSNRVMEIRIQFHPESKAHAGTRRWIENNYPTIKLLNPTLPILIRDGQVKEAAMWARYGWGHEEKIVLQDADEDTVEKSLQKLFEIGKLKDRSPDFDSREPVVKDDFHFALYKKFPTS